MIQKQTLMLVTVATVVVIGLLELATITVFSNTVWATPRAAHYGYRNADNTNSKCFDTKEECRDAQSSDSDASSKCHKVYSDI